MSLDDKMSSGFTKAGDNLQKFGRETLVLSAAVAGLGAASVAAAMKFDQTMTKMSSLAGVAAGDLEMVKQHILDLAPASGVGPQALADAMMVISSVTDDTVTGLTILDVAAKASAVGMGEAKDVARALTSVIGAYGKENITAAQAADILTQTVKDGGAEANELAPILANVIPAASQLGISFAQVGANIATVTKLGTPAAEAVTQLSAVMTALVKPTNDGEKALGSVGLSYQKLRDIVKEQGLQAALQLVSDKFKDNSEKLADVFGRVEAFRNVLATTGKQAEIYAEEVDRITKSTGALQKAEDIHAKSPGAAWDKFTASIQVAAIQLGDRLIPSLVKVTEALKPMISFVEGAIKAFAGLPAPIQMTVVALLAFVAVMAPLALGLGAVMTAGGTVIGMALKLGTAFTALGVTSAAETVALQAMYAAEVQVATGAAGLIAAAAAAAAVGVAVGLLIKTLADERIALDKLHDSENAAAAQNVIILANAEKQRKANESAIETARRLNKEKNEASAAAAKLIPMTDKEIKEALEHVKVQDKLAKVFQLTGKTITDVKLADKIIAMSEANKSAKTAVKDLDKELDFQERMTAAVSGAIKDYWDAQSDAIEKDQDRRAVLQELNKELKAGELAQLKQNNALTELGRVIDPASGLWTRYADVVEQEMENANAAWEEHQAILDRQEGLENLFAMADAFIQVGEAVGGPFGSAIAGLGDVFDGLAQHEAQALDNLEQYGDSSMRTAQKIQLVAQAIAAVVDIVKKNSENLSAAGATMSGAASGAKAGAQTGTWVGVVIGAIAGALIGYFSGQGFRAMAKRAGEVLGVEMTQELAKAVKNTMKEFKTDVAVAALLNLDKAMATGQKRASDFGSQINQLFYLVERGGKIGVEALEQIDKAFMKLAEEGGPAAKKVMGEMIQQGLAIGQLSKGMADFVSEAVGKMASGSEKILEGLSLININVPLGEMGTAAAQFFVAGFTAKIAEVGIVEAISQTGTQITDLYNKLMDEGNIAGAAMLAPFQQLADAINNEADPSVKGFLLTLQGMGEVFAGMDAMGFVSAQSFQGLETAIGGTVNALSEAGITGQAMFMAIAPQLAQIIDAHERYGFVIDDSTQALIDEAEQAGISFPTDPIQILVDLVGQLVVLMGGTLPESMTRIPPAAEAAFSEAAASADKLEGDVTDSMDALTTNTTTTMEEMAVSLESAMEAASGTAMLALDDVAGKLEAIPSNKDVSINVSFNRQGMPRNDDGSIDWDGNPANSFRGGSLGFKDFGSGEPAMLHGEEFVGTRDQMDAIIETALRGGGKATQSQDGGDIHIYVTIPGEPVIHFVEKASKRNQLRIHPNAVKAF